MRYPLSIAAALLASIAPVKFAAAQVSPIDLLKAAIAAEGGAEAGKALKGVSIEVPEQGTVRVRIPPGADTGSVIRLAGRGAPGPRGGPPGDLVIETEVRPHPVLRRDGLDLYLALPVTLDEAYNGASVDVPTFDGTVVLKIPPRSQNHARLRLRGKGIARKTSRGDLFVELDVRMPDQPDDALAEALRNSTSAYARPVREGLAL
jgi:DnaJ-class molecular chaperone